MANDHDKKGAYPGGFWDDLRSPATAINPPGQAADPDVDANSGLLLFDAGGTELVYVINQMPHGWIEGTTLKPHVHWMKTTSAAGNVLWRMRYRWANVRGILTDWSDPVSEATVATADNDTANEHMITSFGDIDIPEGRLSMMMIFEIARIGGDALDTYAADAALLEFDVHYKKNAPGSVQEFIKYNDERQYI